VMRTELTDEYVPNWENKLSAKQMVQAWADRLRKALDDAHAMHANMK
jgi:hypothetical protein